MSISDGAHSSGNPHFFWLPPMVNQPAFSGTFDAGASPVLEICNGVSADGECVTTVATYTTTSGPGGEVIHENSLDQLYQVNVHTDVVGLVSPVTYRWRLMLQGFELGHADIVIAENGREAKNVTNDQFIGLVDGRTLPTKFRIEEGALAAACAALLDGCGGGTVTAETGGLVTVQSSAGLVVAGASIPAGAVNQATEIFIRRIDQVPCLPTSRKQVPGCYEFIADPPLVGGFNTSVLVGVCIDATGLSAAEIERGRLYKSDEGEPNVRELPETHAPFLSCDSPTIGSAGSNALFRFASAGWRAVQRYLNPWFAPLPAFAIDLGLGGVIGPGDGFSTIGWAVEHVLIYGPSMSAPDPTGPPARPENEQTLAADSGFGVTVASAATWGTMSAGGIGGFGDYDAIVFGDPTCSTDPSLLAAANGNKAVWSPVVTGPGIVIGTDPQWHQFMASPQGPTALQLIRNGIRYAASGTSTGFYAALSCYFAGAAASPPTAVDFLSGIGTFQVIGQGGCPSTVNIVATSHSAMATLTNAGLSDWGCSPHEFFPSLTSFPSTFSVIAEGVRPADGSTLPYIVARP